MNCIIIEDEIPAQNLIKNYLSKLPNLKLKGVFNAAIEAHHFLKTNTVPFNSGFHCTSCGRNENLIVRQRFLIFHL